MQYAHRRRAFMGVLVGALVLVTLGVMTGRVEAADVRKFTLINVLLDGSKIWLPSTLIVRQGEKVEITLMNKLDDLHGFKIANFGIETTVQPKSTATVRFTASKAGLYPFICHIHPPHIGGQILVIK